MVIVCQSLNENANVPEQGRMGYFMKMMYAKKESLISEMNSNQ